MNPRLAAARIWVPAPVKKTLLRDLSAAAARAFGRTAPAPGHQSYREALAAFRDFTREGAEALMSADGGSGAVRESARLELFKSGRLFGARIRGLLRIATPAEAMSAARILYRAIGIDFRGFPDGRVVVRACGFSSSYSPEVCGLISALDDGVLAGLHGGGRFRFARRITEGAPACEGFFETGGSGE